MVVLNDNGMSIAPNVGALSRYFNRVRLNPKLWHAREGVESGSRSCRPGSARASSASGRSSRSRSRRSGRRACSGRSSTWPTWASIDGHDVPRAARGAARSARRRAAGRRPHRDGQGQGLRAGRGRRPGGHGEVARGEAEVDRERRARARRAPAPRRRRRAAAAVHEGVRRGDRRGVRARRARPRDHRRDDPGTGLDILRKALPERYFDVGIAEQQALLFAAGLALEGLKPVAAIYSTFLQRAFDQIVHDVCLQNSTSCSRWTAPGSSATTGRRTTACSTSRTCAACRTSC